MWFQGSTTLATRQFQLARLYGELAAADAICADAGKRHALDRRRRGGLAARGARLLPRRRDRVSLFQFLQDAEAAAYDIDHLRQVYNAQFRAGGPSPGVAAAAGRGGHSLRLPALRPGRAADQAFSAAGPAAAQYAAMPARSGRSMAPSGTPDTLLRQVVRFSDGSRYLFLARTRAAPAGLVSRAAGVCRRSCWPATCCMPTAPSMAPGLDLLRPDGRRARRPELPALHARATAQPAGRGAVAWRTALGNRGSACCPQNSALAIRHDCALVTQFAEGRPRVHRGDIWQSTF